jgi:hypothetical protein
MIFDKILVLLVAVTHHTAAIHSDNGYSALAHAKSAWCFVYMLGVWRLFIIVANSRYCLLLERLVIVVVVVIVQECTIRLLRKKTHILRSS